MFRKFAATSLASLAIGAAALAAASVMTVSPAAAGRPRLLGPSPLAALQ